MENYRLKIGQNRSKFPVQQKLSGHIIRVTRDLFALHSRRFDHTHKTYRPAAERVSLVGNIQSDSGGICNTLGNDSVCDSKQKSSYEYVSDFERLPRYGKKKIRIILRARTAIK